MRSPPVLDSAFAVQVSPWGNYAAMMTSGGGEIVGAGWCQGCGPTAGQQILSMIGAGNAYDKDGAYSDSNYDPDALVDCDSLKPYFDEDLDEQSTGCPNSPTDMPTEINVPLEEMSNLDGSWDQFEVNEKQYGVKSSFHTDLSQYSTHLHLSEIPADIRIEAERIAAEIEDGHKTNPLFGGDAIDIDGDDDEEAKFSAVGRQLADMQQTVA